MIIEHKLNMDKQIECMYKKTNKKLGILSKIRMFISSSTAARIYKTMIRPHMEYVDFIIESGSKVWISKLERRFVVLNIVKKLKIERNTVNLNKNIILRILQIDENIVSLGICITRVKMK